MEGVTILSQEVVSYNWAFVILTIIAVFLAVFLIGIIILFIKERDWEFSFVFVLIIIVIVLIVTIGGAIHAHGMKDYIKYKVIIDDNISFNEFNEKHEVLKQDGLIYEVKEK